MPKRKLSATSGTATGRSGPVDVTTSASSNNPLSDARKSHSGKSRQSKSTISPKDQKSLDLWHRKSGAGYALFVRYYGAQPLGVVVDEQSVDLVGGVSNNAAGIKEKVTGQPRGKGMSRAAKKRRRKKGKGPDNANDNTKSGGGEEKNQSAPKTALPQHNIDTSHPLIQAFQSQSKKYSHLAPYIYALSKPLPLTFRLRNENVASSNNRSEAIKLLATRHSNLVQPVSYDSSETIYQATAQSHLSKANLSKTSPHLKELLVEGSLNGTLARQELGSMLPVLALSNSNNSLQPGSRLLDLCASPGSKTLQALEIVATPHRTTGKRGRVVANDVHAGRLDSLRDAVGRSGLDDALASRITYTNFDASLFPSPRSGKLFDAIIADVPCSGDGTIRKDKHVLPMWTPGTGNALHGLQVRILIRALELVKVGGIVCYSTCSLNPIEDEAVVSAALKKIYKKALSTNGKDCDDDDASPAAAELIEWPGKLLPDFIRRPGVTSWRVGSYRQEDRDSPSSKNTDGDEEDESDDFGNLSFYETFEDAKLDDMENAERSMWPDSDTNSLRLERCSRLLPQDQDSGGFFVALIRRNR